MTTPDIPTPPRAYAEVDRDLRAVEHEVNGGSLALDYAGLLETALSRAGGGNVAATRDIVAAYLHGRGIERPAADALMDRLTAVYQEWRDTDD